MEHEPNPDSASYYEICIDTEDLINCEADEIISAIDEYLSNTKPHDLITLRISRDNSNTSADKVLIIESRFKLEKRFSIIKKIVADDEKEKEEKYKERKSKYSYILDPTMKVAAIMYRYYDEDMRPKINPDAPQAKLTEEDFNAIFDSLD